MATGWGQTPRDVRRLILKPRMTLDEFLVLRSSSKDVKDFIEDYVINLTPKEDQDEKGSLFPELVIDLNKIEIISPEYPIVVSTVEQLLLLANHPTLIEAAFDVTDLLSNLYDLVFAFFREYPTFGHECDDCQDLILGYKASGYNFTFFKEISGLEYSIIQVYEGGILIRNTPPETLEKVKIFYRDLSQFIPLCRYTGDLSGLEGVSFVSCLNEITLTNLIRVLSRSRSDQEYLAGRVSYFLNYGLLPNVTRYDAIYPKMTPDDLALGYRPFLPAFAQGVAFNLRQVQGNKITTFFPIPIEIFPRIKNYLPNLTSIAFSLFSLQNEVRVFVAADFADYETIYLVVDLDITMDQEKYIAPFPEKVRDRLVFV